MQLHMLHIFILDCSFPFLFDVGLCNSDISAHVIFIYLFNLFIYLFIYLLYLFIDLYIIYEHNYIIIKGQLFANELVVATAPSVLHLTLRPMENSSCEAAARPAEAGHQSLRGRKLTMSSRTIKTEGRVPRKEVDDFL